MSKRLADGEVGLDKQMAIDFCGCHLVCLLISTVFFDLVLSLIFVI